MIDHLLALVKVSEKCPAPYLHVAQILANFEDLTKKFTLEFMKDQEAANDAIDAVIVLLKNHKKV